MTPNEKQDWITVDSPPDNDRIVEIQDEKGVIREGYACYYPFDLVLGKIIPLENPVHDKTWMIDETGSFAKGELGEFNIPMFWREIKQEGGE